MIGLKTGDYEREKCYEKEGRRDANDSQCEKQCEETIIQRWRKRGSKGMIPDDDLGLDLGRADCKL